MGIDVDGGMLIGARWDDDIIKDVIDEGDYDDNMDWVESCGLQIWSPYYDSPLEDSYIVFPLCDIKVGDMSIKWLSDCKVKGEDFKKLTGITPWLIGSQDIT